MTGVFRQDIFNYIVKAQYRLLTKMWVEQKLQIPEPVTILTSGDIVDGLDKNFKGNESVYDKIMIYYGTETGTSLRYATSLVVNIGDEICTGPFPKNNLSVQLQNTSVDIEYRLLVLVLMTTFGRGCSPNKASDFMPRKKKIGKQVTGIDFGVVSIFQTTYIFPEAKKAGLTSRWLRSLNAGDRVIG